jgi:hypothetical protein
MGRNVHRIDGSLPVDEVQKKILQSLGLPERRPG